jgi:hypothetical protein
MGSPIFKVATIALEEHQPVPGKCQRLSVENGNGSLTPYWN